MVKIKVEQSLEGVDSRLLIQELCNRGVSLKEVFGVYYELGEQSTQLTVEDAEMVGYTTKHTFNPQEGF